MTYSTPAVASRQVIAEAFVLGSNYATPTWTEQADKPDQDR